MTLFTVVLLPPQKCHRLNELLIVNCSSNYYFNYWCVCVLRLDLGCCDPLCVQTSNMVVLSLLPFFIGLWTFVYQIKTSGALAHTLHVPVKAKFPGT